MHFLFSDILWKKREETEREPQRTAENRKIIKNIEETDPKQNTLKIYAREQDYSPSQFTQPVDKSLDKHAGLSIMGNRRI